MCELLENWCFNMKIVESSVFRKYTTNTKEIHAKVLQRSGI